MFNSGEMGACESEHCKMIEKPDNKRNNEKINNYNNNQENKIVILLTKKDKQNDTDMVLIWKIIKIYRMIVKKQNQ